MTNQRSSVIRPRDSLPTNRVKLINTGVPEDTQFVLLESGNKQAIFQAEVKSDDFPTAGPTVRAHPNVTELFPNKNNDERFPNVLVEQLQSERNIQECKEVTIIVDTSEKRRVKEYLEDDIRLVRPIVEEHENKNGRVKFEVFDPSPTAPCQTYLIRPEETDITYKTPEDFTDEGGNSEEETGDGDDLGQPYTQKLSDESMDDVVGLSEVKEYGKALLQLYDDQAFKELKDKYSEDIISKEGSVLLYGPPGCGKTMIVEALANKFVEELDRDVVYMHVSGSDILSKLQGQSEKKVKKVFTEARSKASDNDFTFLFFDEVESLVRDRNADSNQGSRVSITNEFLNQMNQLPENVLVVGATNMPFQMDSAASRRFHTKLLCRHPTEEEMKQKWETSLKNVDHKENSLDYDELSSLTYGYTPAEIDDRILGSEVQTDIINEYIEGTAKEITMDYLKEKIEDIEPRTIPEYISKMEKQMKRNKMEGYGDMEEYIKNNQDIG